eukprot:TRINITY_DN54208_c0_g2_i1.p1 TRINITY_DN54208_c0_g2~~TRINITY_DN54208_c0_g2_i1.p1  ORF type:complete len:179 (+),score=19.15 TRINITY_DN54208_c0_g2_i1:81-539(+)
MRISAAAAKNKTQKFIDGSASAQRQRETENQRWCQAALDDIALLVEKQTENAKDKELQQSAPQDGIRSVSYEFKHQDYPVNIQIEGTDSYLIASFPPYHLVLEALQDSGFSAQLQRLPSSSWHNVDEVDRPTAAIQSTKQGNDYPHKVIVRW